jgi:seryl-tRNA synthetase
MIDIQLIRENPELIKQKAKNKGYDVDTDEILGFDQKRRELIADIEKLRQKRKQIASSAKGQKPSPDSLEEGRKLKDDLLTTEHRLSAIELSLTNLLKKVPNMPNEDVPVGKSEEENQIIKEVGDKPNFDFNPINHAELAKNRGWLDTNRAAKIAGSRFFYLKGDLVNLQFAIIRYTLDTLGDSSVIKKIVSDNSLDISPKPFIPVIPPALIKTEVYEASARLDAEEITYKIDQDDLWLNASAEHSLCTMYMNEIIPEEELPIRMIGYSTSFRREAGSYGKDMEGMFRTHQFDKLEMEIFSTPETSYNEHLLLVAIEEYLMNQLELPYQVILKCTADIGFPNARGIDINTWLPGQNRYRETHSADYITDFQTRRLKTRIKRKDGRIELAHTNDATAFALSRIPIAIMENNQTKDGQVKIPKVLQQYMNGKTVI